MLEIVYIVFVSAFVVQMLYYWGVFSRLAFYRKKASDKSLYRPVSVVISAKNEFLNLQQNLPLILEQEYPDFEVVIVNDCSDDDTDYLLRDLVKRYDKLKVVNITNNVNFFTGKKFPLSMGIKSAKNEFLLLTDADCRPNSKNWIHEMQSNYTDKTSIVLGYGAYEKKKGFLNKLIRYDSLRIAIEYFSLALSGFPYMGVGRNLSYTKKLFFENKGFTSHYRIKSGDDDLFINQAATSNNTRIEISTDSHTISEPKTNLNDWIKQKKRHLTTGKYYKTKHKFILGLFALSQLLFISGLIVLLVYLCISISISGYEFKDISKLVIILSLLIVRLLSQLIINKKCIDKLNEKNLLLFSPIFEIFVMFLNIYLFFFNLFYKNNTWK